MLVIVWERAWEHMWRLEALESIRAFNIAVLANPYADPDERRQFLSDWEMLATPRRQPGSLKRFKNWALNVARNLFGIDASG